MVYENKNENANAIQIKLQILHIKNKHTVANSRQNFKPSQIV